MGNPIGNFLRGVSTIFSEAGAGVKAIKELKENPVKLAENVVAGLEPIR